VLFLAVLSAAVLVPAAAAARRPAVEPPPPAPRFQQVVLFGSSSMSLPDAPLVRAFRRALPGARMSARGRQGWTVRAWLRAMPEREVRGADLVIVYLGANDTVHHARDVAELDCRLRSQGAHVVWLRPPAFEDPELARRSQAMWAAIEEAGVRRLSGSYRPSSVETGDGLHVNAKGAAHWVDLVAPELTAAADAPVRACDA
jgi:lysophospholipase L1-like esterase